MITIEFNANSYNELKRRLGKMSSQAPSVMKKAINDTTKSTKKTLSSTAKKSYTTKNPGYSNAMKTRGATVNRLQAVISSSGEPLPLLRFRVSAGKRATKVKIIKANGLKELTKTSGKPVKAFVNNIARKGQIRRKKTAKGAAGTAVIHRAVAQREKANKRLKIHEKFGPSIPAQLGSVFVKEEIAIKIADTLHDSLEKHIDKILSGGKQ